VRRNGDVKLEPLVDDDEQAARIQASQVARTRT